MLFRRREEIVLGHYLPAPRITTTGLWLVFVYLALPTLALLLAFDVLVWLFAYFTFDACVAVWCLI